MAEFAIPAAATLIGAGIGSKSQSGSQNKQLAYAREQDAKNEARQREIDAAERAQVAQQNAYIAAQQKYASEYNLWRYAKISGKTNSPPPTFNFDYNGMTPPPSSAPVPRTLGAMAAGNPVPAPVAMAAQTPATLGDLAQQTPWDWGAGDTRGRKMPTNTLASLAGRV